MRTERFTTRATEAIVAAQQLAEGEGHPELTRCTCSCRWSTSPTASSRPSWSGSARIRRAVAEALRGELAKLPKVSGAATQLTLSNEARRVLTDAHAMAERMHDEYVSTEHLLLAIIEDAAGNSAASSVLRGLGVDGRIGPGGAHQHPRQPARDQREPRGDLRGPGEVRPRPDRCRPQGAARPGHRPRRGDPPRHPGAQPPDQEQPGPDRRAGRRQDGDRRGAGPADRARRRARGPAREARGGPGPRRPGGRAPSTAASSRSA